MSSQFDQFLDLISVPVAPVIAWADANAHPNTVGKLLMEDGRLVWFFCLAYLVVIFGGIQVMKKREPFVLRGFSIVHNAFLVVLSGYMAYELLRIVITTYDSPWCNDVKDGESGAAMANVVHIFYVSKLYEFLDTIIMVLRKKEKQISFLHVYHHFSIFPYWYLISRTVPGGDAWFTAFLNSSVHVAMYSYYFCALFKIPAPWKSFITMGQMLQFCLFLCQAFYTYFAGCHSGAQAVIGQGLIFYALSLLVLFANFYIQSYSKPRGSTGRVTRSKAKKQE